MVQLSPRYGGDIGMIFLTSGLEKLLEFTEYIKSLYPPPLILNRYIRPIRLMFWISLCDLMMVIDKLMSILNLQIVICIYHTSVPTHCIVKKPSHVGLL